MELVAEKRAGVRVPGVERGLKFEVRAGRRRRGRKTGAPVPKRRRQRPSGEPAGAGGTCWCASAQTSMDHSHKRLPQSGWSLKFSMWAHGSRVANLFMVRRRSPHPNVEEHDVRMGHPDLVSPKKTLCSAQNLENKGPGFFLPPRSMVLNVVRGKIFKTLELQRSLLPAVPFWDLRTNVPRPKAVAVLRLSKIAFIL
jgi:hypothetical protein